MKQTPLMFRAMSPDNETDIRQLVGLFHKAYGDSFPMKKVYNTDFWRTHIGGRFSSVAAWDGPDMVGHFAFQTDTDDPPNVQLMLPVYDPDCRNELPAMIEQTVSFINDLSKRQGWQSMYTFIFPWQREMETFFIGALGAVEVGVCPGFLPAGAYWYRKKAREDSVSRASCTKRNAVVLAQKILARPQQSERQLFVPNAHRDMCEFIYRPLGLKRSFADIPKSGISLNGSGSKAGIKSQYFKNSKVCQAFIDPSIAGAPETALNNLCQGLSEATFCYVNMEDPACPAFCEGLEQLGFYFSGVVSRIEDRDSIVYSSRNPLEVDINDFNTPRARIIAEYMRNYQPTNTVNPVLMVEHGNALDPHVR